MSTMVAMSYLLTTFIFVLLVASGESVAMEVGEQGKPVLCFSADQVSTSTASGNFECNATALNRLSIEHNPRFTYGTVGSAEILHEMRKYKVQFRNQKRVNLCYSETEGDARVRIDTFALISPHANEMSIKIEIGERFFSHNLFPAIESSVSREFGGPLSGNRDRSRDDELSGSRASQEMYKRKMAAIQVVIAHEVAHAVQLGDYLPGASDLRYFRYFMIGNAEPSSKAMAKYTAQDVRLMAEAEADMLAGALCSLQGVAPLEGTTLASVMHPISYYLWNSISDYPPPEERVSLFNMGYSMVDHISGRGRANDRNRSAWKLSALPIEDIRREARYLFYSWNNPTKAQVGFSLRVICEQYNELYKLLIELENLYNTDLEGREPEGKWLTLMSQLDDQVKVIRSLKGGDARTGTIQLKDVSTRSEIRTESEEFSVIWTLSEIVGNEYDCITASMKDKMIAAIESSGEFQGYWERINRIKNPNYLNVPDKARWMVDLQEAKEALLGAVRPLVSVEDSAVKGNIIMTLAWR